MYISTKKIRNMPALKNHMFKCPIVELDISKLRLEELLNDT